MWLFLFFILGIVLGYVIDKVHKVRINQHLLDNREFKSNCVLVPNFDCENESKIKWPENTWFQLRLREHGSQHHTG